MGCLHGAGWGLLVPHPGKPLEGTRLQNYKFMANAVSCCRFWSGSPNGFVWTRTGGEAAHLPLS